MILMTWRHSLRDLANSVGSSSQKVGWPATLLQTAPRGGLATGDGFILKCLSLSPVPVVGIYSGMRSVVRVREFDAARQMLIGEDTEISVTAIVLAMTI